MPTRLPKRSLATGCSPEASEIATATLGQAGIPCQPLPPFRNPKDYYQPVAVTGPAQGAEAMYLGWRRYDAAHPWSGGQSGKTRFASDFIRTHQAFCDVLTTLADAGLVAPDIFDEAGYLPNRNLHNLKQSYRQSAAMLDALGNLMQSLHTPYIATTPGGGQFRFRPGRPGQPQDTTRTLAPAWCSNAAQAVGCATIESRRAEAGVLSLITPPADTNLPVVSTRSTTRRGAETDEVSLSPNLTPSCPRTKQMGKPITLAAYEPLPHPVVALLTATHNIIAEPACWTKGAGARDELGIPCDPWDRQATCWCLPGAMVSAAHHLNISIHSRFYDRARWLVEGRMPENLISRHNDDPETTHADMLSKLDEAIAIARASRNCDA